MSPARWGPPGMGAPRHDSSGEPYQEKLQKGKEDVRLDKIEPVGNYAVKLVFDDGHDSGLYSWEYLHELCKDYKKNWHDYLDRLNKSGYARKKP